MGDRVLHWGDHDTVISIDIAKKIRMLSCEGIDFYVIVDKTKNEAVSVETSYEQVRKMLEADDNLIFDICYCGR